MSGGLVKHLSSVFGGELRLLLLLLAGLTVREC